MIFEPGDIVILKSGGPEMTVEIGEKKQSSISTPYVTAIWFDKRDILNRDTFLVHTIKIVKLS